jgi:hypothetical protein
MLFLIVEVQSRPVALQATDVIFSHQPISRIASSGLVPQTSGSAANWPHTAGLPGCPNMPQSMSSDRCRQRMPAGLPLGMPGIGEVMDGAMQHAPQPGRHSMKRTCVAVVRTITGYYALKHTFEIGR